MRRILVIASYVAHGTVGLQATLPAFAGGDFDVTALPTILLSNHPGHKKCAGTAIAPELLAAMVDALEGNGWLAGLHGVLTGYLPSAAHVAWARQTVERVKAANPKALYLADPVLGDDPGGLYISKDTAEAIRDLLLPIADITTPNRFELAWLTGLPVDDETSATVAARRLNRQLLAATSIPAGPDLLDNLIVDSCEHHTFSVARIPDAPHGTGDYFAGLLLAARLDGQSAQKALKAAASGVAQAIAASAGCSHLRFNNIGRDRDALS